MMKILLMVVAVLVFASGAFAEDVQVTITCPASAKAGTSTAIANVAFKGVLCPSVTFNRLLRGTVGNTAGATLGQLGIVGPIQQAMTARTINCGATGTAMNVYVPTTAGMVNTAATFFVQVLDSKGQVIGSNSCSFPVVP